MEAESIEESALESRVVVIGTTPLEGSEIDPDKIPAGTYALEGDALGHDVSSSLPDALLRRVPSAQINDVTGNPFQPDVRYRGYTASPVLGTPQGLAVYQNSVRTNEAFGDTVNWDLIPEFAVEGLEIVSNNPAFGLNAVGGALAVKMKNGFTFHDFEIEFYGGAFGRISAMAEAGLQRGQPWFLSWRGCTRRQGMEAHVQYHDARWSAHAGYSFLDATFQSRLAISSPFNPVADADGIVRVTPGDELASAPRHRFKAGVDYAFTPKWKAGAELIAVSSQYLEGDVSNRNPEIPAYYIVNVHTSYAVTRNCELFGRIQNLFDRRYYTSGTFFDAGSIPSLHLWDLRTLTPASPLAAYAGVRIKW